MREKTKPRIHRISGTPTGDVWVWNCGRPRCLEWTHTPNITVAPRGIGYASRWDRATHDLEQHLEEHPVERPAWLMPALLVWIALVLAGVVAMSYAWDTTEPAPAPSPSPSSRPWSEDCTAEELNTGVCYLTYDDIRNQPTYTQSP